MNIYLSKIKSISFPNKYTKWYIELILKGKNRALNKKHAQSICGYVEKHHIVPKSFKPDDTDHLDNIVYLTAREHLVAHLLLSKMFNNGYYQKKLERKFLMHQKEIKNVKVAN